MGTICEHEFERRDNKYPDYSHTEYDLKAGLNLTIVKNVKIILKTKFSIR